MDFSQFFKVNKKDQTCAFTGDSLKIKIPNRYANYNLLTVEQTVSTLAIFEMVINEKHSLGYLLPVVINIAPSSVDREVIDGEEFTVLNLIEGDLFMTNTELIKVPAIAYAMFTEFVTLGHLPSFLTYEDCATLFSKTEKYCGVNLKVPSVIFEMIFSHLFRDSDDLTVPYRLTEMKKPPKFVELRSVSFGPPTTLGKIVGSYAQDGVNSAIVHPAEQNTELEDILRS